MQEPNFDEVLDQILARDPRYHRDAYGFLREALDYTQKNVAKAGKKDAPHHVTGQQLLQGFREYALSQFGPMTLSLLEEWGVRRGEDVGEIVFNMVEARLLSKTAEDSREDFKGGYDFYEAFRRPFLPARTPPAPVTPPSASPTGAAAG